MQETWVRSLGWEDPREGKGYPLQYSGLENSTVCIAMGSQWVGHDWVTFSSQKIWKQCWEMKWVDSLKVKSHFFPQHFFFFSSSIQLKSWQPRIENIDYILNHPSTEKDFLMLTWNLYLGLYYSACQCDTATPAQFWPECIAATIAILLRKNLGIAEQWEFRHLIYKSD